MVWDKTWESLFSTRAWGKYPGEDVVRFVARNFYKVDDRMSIKILEIGCGTGANIWFMAREGFSVFGIDGSTTAIDICRDRLNQEVSNWSGELHCGDIGKLHFPDNFFDAVIDIEAVSCNQFEDAKIIYSEMVRVLKTGGKLYSRCFAKGTSGDETGEQLSYNTYRCSIGSMQDTGVTRFTTREDIDQLLSSLVKNIEVDVIERGRLSNNVVIEWCITAEK